MSPSFEARELTAAPYLGKGLCWLEVSDSCRCDQGYKLVFEGGFVGVFGPLAVPGRGGPNYRQLTSVRFNGNVPTDCS
jgi:hypothetical protein